MKINIDERVGSNDLEPHIRKLGCAVNVCRLDSGDAWFIGEGPDGDLLRIGIERKNIRDFAASVATGRLMGKQWPKMQASYDRVYLIVEGILRTRNDGALEEMRFGKWYPVRDGNSKNSVMSHAMLYAMFASMQEFGCMRIMQTGTPEDTARVCVSLVRWWSKPYESHSAHNPIVIESVEDPMNFRGHTSFLVKVLAQVKGVGAKRAREIAAEYGTVEELLMCSKIQLQEAHGKITGKSIYEALRA